MATWNLRGRVISGLGRGAHFTQLGWACRAFRTRLGIEPYPGTLNLWLDARALAVWQAVRTQPEMTIAPPPDQGCAAHCFAVRIAGRLPAAIVLPDVAGYPPHQVEMVAAVPLRAELELRDGDEMVLSGGTRPPVRAAIFDVDGTLVDSIEGMRLAAAKAAARYGYTVSSEMVCRALNFGESLWELVIPQKARTDPELLQVLRRETRRHWPEVLESAVAPFPGLEATLRALREAGIQLAIYTGSRGESFLPLQRAGLLEWFNPILTAADVAYPKPHPEGLQRILAQLGLRPEEAAYIGDTRHDILAGRAAGTRTIGVLTGAADSALLSRAGADRLVADHCQLPDLLL